MPRSSIRNKRKKSTPVGFEEKHIWGLSWLFSVLMSWGILKFLPALEEVMLAQDKLMLY